jgi:hypothetical protein
MVDRMIRLIIIAAFLLLWLAAPAVAASAWEALGNGCSAGPLSDFLNSIFRACCDRHDYELSQSYDLADFIAGNIRFARCTVEVNKFWGAIASAAVWTPIGLLMFYCSDKEGVKR